MIYDCFPFFNELDVLEIRLNELKDVVDQFVLIESNYTYSGLPKSLFFEENKDRFKNFNIESFVLPNMSTATIWERDHAQRGYISEVLKNYYQCKDTDIIMVSDADEIPRAELVSRYKPEYGLLAFEMPYHYYWLNLRGYIQDGTRISNYETFKKYKNGHDYRFSREAMHIKDAGWHFSYLGDLEHIYYKLEAHSHQEFNNSFFMDKERIKKIIEEGKDLFDRQVDLFGRKMKWEFVEITDWYPKYVCNNIDKFQHLIKKM